ncbi:MAG: nitrate- and nitrite sensing domain-containing protein, partial [Streptosporangiaceae bacterium]
MLLSAFRAPRGRVRGSALAPRNWRVASRLILLAAIPAILGLTLAGLRMSSAMSSARAYAKVTQNAALGQQVAGLAHALESERAGAAVFVADGRPASGLAALDRQYASTDARAAGVRRLVARLDR